MQIIKVVISKKHWNDTKIMSRLDKEIIHRQG